MVAAGFLPNGGGCRGVLCGPAGPMTVSNQAAWGQAWGDPRTLFIVLWERRHSVVILPRFTLGPPASS